MKMFEGTPRSVCDGVSPAYYYNLWSSETKHLNDLVEVLVDEFGKDFSYQDAYFYTSKIRKMSQNDTTTAANAALIKANSRYAKVFNFSDDLMKALENTSAPKHIPDIRLPFKSIIINEWTLIECEGHIRGVRLFKDEKGYESIDFLRIKTNGDYDIIRERCGVLINMLLYLTSEKPDLISETKSVQKRRGGKKGFVRDVIYVGRRYKYSEGTANHRGGVNCRFIVRSHWRQQPTKDGYKRIWIESHWKGPDMAEVINKTYKVI